MALTRSILFCAILGLLVWFTSAVMTPPALSRQAWYTYRQLPKGNVDTLFLGTSHVYSAIDPAVVDEARRTAGHTGSGESFVLSGSGQSMALTYYTLKDALRFQQPKTVAVEAFRIIGEQRMADNNAKANFHYWPWSVAKVQALLDATKIDNRENIAVPLVEYHSRWTELTRGDFGISLPLPGVPAGKMQVGSKLRGYSPVRHTKKIIPLAPTIASIDEAAWNRNFPWLKKIAQLCNEKGIQLVLFWAPNAMEGQSTYIEEIQSALESEYPSIRYIDFNSAIPKIGLRYDTDFADETHTNVAGAKKVSTYMGEILLKVARD